MHKLVVLPVLLFSVATGSVFATTTTDPVTGAVQSTEHVMKAVGNGTVKTTKDVGKATKDVLVGTGHAVEAVGKGAADLVTGK